MPYFIDQNRNHRIWWYDLGDGTKKNSESLYMVSINEILHKQNAILVKHRVAEN